MRFTFGHYMTFEFDVAIRKMNQLLISLTPYSLNMVHENIVLLHRIENRSKMRDHAFDSRFS